MPSERPRKSRCRPGERPILRNGPGPREQSVSQGRHEVGHEGFSSDVVGRTAKHGRHCLRLLIQARHLLRTGDPVIDVGARREELFAAGRLAVEDPAAFTTRFEHGRDRAGAPIIR